MTDKPEMAIATGVPFEKWILTLLHESCHLDQEFDKSIKEKREWWDKCCINFFEWIGGRKQMNQAQLDEAIRGTIDLELDCEKRTVAKIKKFNLGIDTKDYTQKANTYFFGYPIASELRKWTNWVYQQESIWSLAPEKFLPLEDYLLVPHDMHKAFHKYIKKAA